MSCCLRSTAICWCSSPLRLEERSPSRSVQMGEEACTVRAAERSSLSRARVGTQAQCHARVGGAVLALLVSSGCMHWPDPAVFGGGQGSGPHHEVFWRPIAPTIRVGEVVFMTWSTDRSGGRLK